MRSGNGGGEKRIEQVGARHADGIPPPPRGREGVRRDPSSSTREPRSIVLRPHPPLGTPFAPSPASYWLEVTPLLDLPVPIGSSSTLSSPGVSYWLRPHPLIITRLRLQPGLLPQPSFVQSASGAGYFGHGGESDPSLPSGSSGDDGGTRT